MKNSDIKTDIEANFHPLMWQILKKLRERIAEIKKEDGLGYEKIAERSGLVLSAVGHIKTGRRKNIYLDTFLKLTDGLAMDRGLLVEGAQDILSLKVKKVLNGRHRLLIQNILEILLEGSKDKIELMENVVTTLYCQLEEADSQAEVRAKAQEI